MHRGSVSGSSTFKLYSPALPSAWKSQLWAEFLNKPQTIRFSQLVQTHRIPAGRFRLTASLFFTDFNKYGSEQFRLRRPRPGDSRRDVLPAVLSSRSGLRLGSILLKEATAVDWQPMALQQPAWQLPDLTHTNAHAYNEPQGAM